MWCLYITKKNICKKKNTCDYNFGGGAWCAYALIISKISNFELCIYE
jgi:hypothetical protein